MALCKLLFNNYLINDYSSKYWIYFTDISGQSFGNTNAILLKDIDDNYITGYVSGRTSIDVTFDYTGNTQGGRIPNVDVEFTAVSIGLGIGKYTLVSDIINSGITIINFSPDKDWNYTGKTNSGTSGSSGTSGIDGTSGISGGDPMIEISISGIQNKINKDFILSSGITSLSHMVYVDGQLQTYNGDYVISGLTLSFLKISPGATDVIRVFGSVGYSCTSGISGSSGSSGKSGSSGTSGVNGELILEISISGVQNSNNKIFTLSNEIISLSHMFYVDGQLQTHNGDYVLSGLTLTFLRVAPSSTDVLRIFGSIGSSPTIGISTDLDIVVDNIGTIKILKIING